MILYIEIFTIWLRFVSNGVMVRGAETWAGFLPTARPLVAAPAQF